MATVDTITGSTPPLTQVRQRANVQQNEAQEQDKQAVQETQKQDQQRPVVNLQGQTIGANVNTTA